MKQELEAAIAEAVMVAYERPVVVELSRPDPKFGDFATNVALQLARSVGAPPRQIAETLQAKLTQLPTLQKVEVAGPGFLNLWLSDTALIAQMQTRPQRSRDGQTVVIETNNPNPFKAMHIGHAFNAIIADTLANLLEASGAHTYRVSYHGDVGAHVGKSMYSLLRYVVGDPTKLSAIPAAERNTFMSKMYADGARAYKEDPAAKQAIDELAKQSFTRQDPVYAAVYDTCKAWSFEQIDETVARLGNKPTERRFLESDADVRGVPIVRKHVPTVFQESDGALIFPGSKYGSFDNAFVTSSGLGLYAARDLGLMQLKQEYFHPDKSYIVTAEEQKDYFKGVIKAAELALPELAGVTVNISTGTVKLTTGKMSSRDGDVITIDWLFDQIQDALEREGATTQDIVLAGALRYEFLRVRIGSDVIFDIDAAVSIKGNSGPYLQYAHARARSILAKTPTSTVISGALSNFESAERALVQKLGEYHEVVERAATELLPHHICTYLYELAQEFNRFYEHNRVVGDAREQVRVPLVAHYADTLAAGLALLGIHAPDTM